MMADINGTIKRAAAMVGTVGTADNISGNMGAAHDYNLCANKPRINGAELSGNTELTDIVRNFTGTLSADGWSDTAPYMQTVEIDGITADMSPIVDVIISDDAETAAAEQKAWNCITKAVTGDGVITFYCYENKPETAINFKVKAV